MPSQAPTLRAFFLPAAGGPRFCLVHEPPPDLAPRGQIVHLHAFAEEMNCARRIVALQARDFAAKGFRVILIDLFGCGDSAGDFGDATWTDWQADARLACTHFADGSPLWLWGLRAGALLAAQTAAALAPTETPAVAGLLLWQPVLAGTDILRHFLRLGATAQALTGATPAPTLRQQLGERGQVEIAGYTLSARLARSLEAAAWPDELPLATRLIAYETGARPELSPGLQTRVQSWRASGYRVDVNALEGAHFWLSPGHTDAPPLRRASVEALTEGRA